MPSGGLCILAWRTYSKWFPQGSCQGQHLHSCVDFNPSVSPQKSAAFCFTSHETGFRKMATLLAWQPNKSRMSDVSEAKQKPRLHITLNPMTFAHSASSGISDQVMSWKRVYASISAAKKPPVQGCWGMSMGTELSVGCSWCNLCPGVTSLKGFRDLRGIGLVQGCSSVLRSKKSRLIHHVLIKGSDKSVWIHLCQTVTSCHVCNPASQTPPLRIQLRRSRSPVK